MSTSSTDNLVSMHYSPDSGAEARKVKAWNILCQRIRKCSKNGGNMLKEHRNELGGVTSGQIWNNLRIKISVNNGL